MYSETFAKFSLISLHVLVVHLIDGTHLQPQVSIPSDWLKESQDYINRELKIQQDQLREHAENLWRNAHPEVTHTEEKGITTSKPHYDKDVVVVTPSVVTPKITTTEPPPPSTRRPPPLDDEYDFVDLRGTCLPAKTEVWEKGPYGKFKKRKGVCRGSVIFNDDFSRGPGVDNTKWSHEVRMPGNEAHQGFVTYLESNQNSYVKDNKLFIKPTVLDDKRARTGERNLENCTGPPDSIECYRVAKSFQILPPIDSALLTTKHTMSFKYGKIEIRAKLPIGDWIVPEITLEPISTRTYGESNSGRIRLALARGNVRLMQENGDIGNRHLEMGFEIEDRALKPPRIATHNNPEGWGRGFHNYTLIWTPDNLKFQVDDRNPEPLCPQGRPLYESLGIPIGSRKEVWKSASNIAPFDKEFYITLGLSVGGMELFPEIPEKPWGDQKAKALITFWVNRGKWLGSWENNDGQDSTMAIDYVRITAV